MEINWNKIKEEVIDVLRSLIRINTANPPGNELKAAAYLQEILNREGIPSKIYEAAPGRGNLVARLEGSGKLRPLILLSHLDVVGASPRQWTYDPFAGTVADGHIWGRGALDMKGMLAMELLGLLLYKRSGQIPSRDLIFIAAADAETGGDQGIGWLIKQGIPGLAQAEYVLNEGSEGLIRDGVPVYTCQNGEKGLLWVKLSVLGTPGHASMPMKDNAIYHMSKVLNRLNRHKKPVTLTSTSRAFLKQMAAYKGVKPPVNPAALDYSLKLFANRHFSKERSVQAMLYNTVSPTIMRAGEKTNVLPETCELTLDCRLLPGETPEHFLTELQNVINDSQVDMEVVQSAAPTESPLDTGLFQAIQNAVAKENRQAFVVPYLSSRVTDSRFFRYQGITSYGFMPVLLAETEIQRMHGVDERISLANLEQGTRILYSVITEIAG